MLLSLLLGEGELGVARSKDGLMCCESLLHLGAHGQDLLHELLEHELLEHELRVWLHHPQSALPSDVVLVNLQIDAGSLV
jgi:hypothetical protein